MPSTKRNIAMLNMDEMKAASIRRQMWRKAKKQGGVIEVQLKKKVA